MVKITPKYDYPLHVMKAIQEWQEENDNVIMTWEEIQEMSPEWVLACYLEWEGIIGYTDTIKSIMYAEDLANGKDS